MAAAAATITEKFVGSVAISKAPGTTTTTMGYNGLPNDSGNKHGLSCYDYEDTLSGAVEDHQQKVPVWVGVNCKLVSGISKSTTCHDLISSIIPNSQDPLKYVIVEKWKKMERILDPSVKILKVWKAWGDQIGDVSFVLRSSPTADGYIDKKTSRKVHRKRSSSYHQQKIACHEEDCDKEGHRDAMEQLIKLVITQGEAIQAQLKKLRQQEEQIERYEEKMHKIRSSQLGENYVVDAYLKDETKPRRVKRREKSPCKRDHHHHYHHHHHSRQKREQVEEPEQELNDEGVETKQCTNQAAVTKTNPVPNNPTVNPDPEDTPEANEPTELIKEKTELMENIFQLNVRLTQEEERLVKLGLKMRKSSDKQRKAEWEELALQDIAQELDHLKKITNDQSQEIEMNERDLTALEQLLDDKHDHIAFLTHEIQLVDEQSELLQRKVLELSNLEKTPQEAHLSIEQRKCYPSDFQSHNTKSIIPNEERSPNQYSDHYPLQPQQYHEEEDGRHQASSKMKATLKTLPSNSLPPFRSCTEQKPSPVSSTVSYKSQQQASVESCSSSCSNSSSVCVQLNQKQCSSATGGITNNSTDPQDNDSNSDTGISSLHSSVDENPMYVLDTLV